MIMSGFMQRLLAKVRNGILRESGQDLVEYALLAALVAFGATAALRTLGTGLNHAFTNISSTLSSSLT
jgi:pilus assembly protein Flp/PilA